MESLVQRFLPTSSTETETTTETATEGSSYDILLHKGTISGPLLAATPELDVDGVIENFYWPLEKASQPATVSIVGKEGGKDGPGIKASRSEERGVGKGSGGRCGWRGGADRSGL